MRLLSSRGDLHGHSMRTHGAKNSDHEAKRARMVAAIAPVVMCAGADRPSLRAMSKAAGISVNNLRHYFGTREDVLEAVYAAMGAIVEADVRGALSCASLPVAEGISSFLSALVAAWTPERIGGLHRSGISEGLSSESLGPVYLEHIVEPMLAVTEQMLVTWRDRGELDVDDEQLRAAALALIAPVVLALLHQRGLGGSQWRAIAFEPLLDAHVSGFLRGYGSR